MKPTLGVGARTGAVLSALLLGGVEALLPNRPAWPRGYTDGNYDIPLQTFTFNTAHWAYPTFLTLVIVVVVALALLPRWPFLKLGEEARSGARSSVLWVLALGLLAWTGWTFFTAKRPLVDWIHFPPPVVIVQTLGLELKVGQGPLYQQFAVASAKTVLSLVLAVALVWPVAVWTGLRTGRNAKVAGWVIPYSYALSALPPIILFHLVNDFFSPGVLGLILTDIGVMQADQAKEHLRDINWLVNLTLTCWTVFWPIFSAAFTAAKTADRRLLAAAEQLGANARIRFRRIIYPQALEQIYSGVGIGVTMGTIVLLYSEGRSGVGEQLQKGNRIFYPNLGKSVEDFYAEGHLATVLAAMGYAIGIVLLLKFCLHLLAYWRAPWLRQMQPAEASGAGTKHKDYWEYDPEQHLASLKGLYDRLDASGSTDTSPAVVMHDVAARYGSFLLEVPKLEIAPGEFVSIIGESGAGKTSLVELIAGIRMQDGVSGRIDIRGRPILSGEQWCCEPSECGVGMVHQDFALFATMTVRENIWFGLEMKLARLAEQSGKTEVARIRDIAQQAQDELLRFLRLPLNAGFLDRYPRQLSGGQRQRIVLARALLAGNRVLVVDEGFANIDQPTRGRVREGLFRLAALLRLTVICVSHDNQDVLRNSTRIVYMVNESAGGHAVGRIARIASPREFFYEPHSIAAAYFIGHRNIYRAHLLPADGVETRLELTTIDRPDPQQGGGRFEFRRAQSTQDGPRFIPATWINPRRQDETADDFYEAIVTSDHFIGESHEIVLQTDEGLQIHAIVQDDDYGHIHRENPGAQLSGQRIKFRIDGEPLPFTDVAR